NFVHVKDVARAYVRSAERLVEQLSNGETGAETYEIASNEDMSVMRVAEIVREVVREERGIEVNIELMENPRSAETMVEEFEVNISSASNFLGWGTEDGVEGAVRELLE
ncbi:NAD(P)-dependent oxidoreductase, partial [Halorubrum sp. SP3]